MKKGQKMYIGLDAVRVSSKPSNDTVVVTYLQDVFNDSGTIVRRKGDRRTVGVILLSVLPEAWQKT